MGEPTVFQLVIFVISAIVFLLLMAPRKQVERASDAHLLASDGNKKIEPSYCFNDCVRVHGASKNAFCGVACGIKDEQK